MKIDNRIMISNKHTLEDYTSLYLTIDSDEREWKKAKEIIKQRFEENYFRVIRLLTWKREMDENERKVKATLNAFKTSPKVVKQILAQENDFMKAGQPLSDGAITPANILAIEGPMKVQEFIVNEIQEVYRSQGVTINGKHFEVIVRQMMRKVEIDDPGDTRFLEGELVNKLTFQECNDEIFGKVIVTDCGDSENLVNGQMITVRKLRDENSILKRKDKKLVEARDAQPATAHQVLQGITRAALQTESFISAASFQETTKVLTLAAINAKSDTLEGMKENVIVGHKIPAGTGLREYDDLIVGSREDYEPITNVDREVLVEE